MTQHLPLNKVMTSKHYLYIKSLKHTKHRQHIAQISINAACDTTISGSIKQNRLIRSETKQSSQAFSLLFGSSNNFIYTRIACVINSTTHSSRQIIAIHQSHSRIFTWAQQTRGLQEITSSIFISKHRALDVPTQTFQRSTMPSIKIKLI